jgi:rhamnose utilization protein RhaD (predicted bifunctional aldolase and dehydrogenase)
VKKVNTMTTSDTLSAYAGAGLQALARASARLGADPLQVQAAGGNTSLKEDGVLWVKASGLWLRDALSRPLFVAVALDQVRSRIAADEPDPVGPALRPDLTPPGLRPSIETTLHALMPHRVVLHVHAVEALAWAVQPGAERRLGAALAGERWAWVPYERPGLPLTRAVARLLAGRAADVLVLANHGLVVGGDSVDAAVARLEQVVARLRRPLRPAAAPDLEGLARAAAGTGWSLPGTVAAHAVATDAINLARARRGVLYPDHVVFLGTSLAVLPQGQGADALRASLLALQGDAAPPCVAVPGRGVLVRQGLDPAAQELLECWGAVLQRLPADVEPAYLPPSEVEALANWEAEKFRRSQQRQPAAVA